MFDAHDQLWSAKWFEWICWAFCLAVPVLMLWARSYPTIEREGMTTDGISQAFFVASLVFTVVIAVLVSAWAENNTEWVEGSFQRWSFSFLVVMVLMMNCIYGGLVANGALDRAETRVFETVVVGGESYLGGRRNKRRWRLIVADWRGGPGRVQKLNVSKRRYDDTRRGSTVRVTTKPGALGWEWLVSTR